MICVSKPDKKLFARIVLPASKSISNRLLILRHHFGPSLEISNLSGSDDTILLATLLSVLKHYLLSGRGLLRLDAHNSGTVFRFMTALLSVTRGKYLLAGSERMQQRPIGPLVDALRELGADIEYPERPGYPPLLIKGRKIEGGRASVNISLSSQYLSSLLLIAPMLEDGLTLSVKGDRSSWPFVHMTLEILRSLDIRIVEDDDILRIMPAGRVSRRIRVEPDWSSAAFWYAMLSLAEDGEVWFPGLSFSGIQGDEALAGYFAPLGIVSETERGGIRIRSNRQRTAPELLDFRACPDLAMAVILAYAADNLPARFSGLERLRIKESDRLEAMMREMKKAGLTLSPAGEGTWTGGGSLTPGVTIQAEDDGDHRISMTMSCLAVKGLTICIRDPAVVNKSYPGFWDDMQSAGFFLRHSCL